MAVSIVLVSRLCCLAGEQIDVIVTFRRRREEHAVWMEGGGRDGGAAVSVYPSRIRLDGGELLPFEVENLDRVFRCSAIGLLACSGKVGAHNDLHSEYGQVLMRACRA